MSRKLLTVDEFRASVQQDEGHRVDGTVLRLAVAEPIKVEGADRKRRFVFSDGSIDRAGDSIDPHGWELKSFLANPVALWAHDSFSPPIGRASDVAPTGKRLMGDIEFMPPDISPFADSILRMVDGGFIKAVSVGFIPLEWSFAKEADRQFGINFSKQELIEISLCPVPCNPNALQEAKAAGIDTGPLREWASKVLDEGGHILVPRGVLEETFRQAKTPRAIRQKYLAKVATAEFKVGAARDLPIEEASTWDGAAAAKRMLDAAGFDGDSPDAAKAELGFLIHDGANPDLRSSYKLPFADIVDGALKASKAGISAAKGRLSQTDAPQDVRDAAQVVIDGYEKKFGNKTAPKRKRAVRRKGDPDQPRDDHGRWSGDGGGEDSNDSAALRATGASVKDDGTPIEAADAEALHGLVSAAHDAIEGHLSGLYDTSSELESAADTAKETEGELEEGYQYDDPKDQEDYENRLHDAGAEAAKAAFAARDKLQALIAAAQGHLDKVNEKIGDLNKGYAWPSKMLAAPLQKAGRRISAANESKLREAMDHHESASQCIKDVLGTNAVDEDMDDDGDGDSGDQADDKSVIAQSSDAKSDERATRLAEAKALRASVKI